MHDTPSTTVLAAQDSGSPRLLGALLVAQSLLAFAPLAVLAPAIGWPASLRLPAAEQLAAIHAAPGAVASGYGLYLLYSVLIGPAFIGLAAQCLRGAAAWTVVALAAMSALARSIGILRWLTVMPSLAAAHRSAGLAEQAQIELVFDAISAFGGGIGELLGVSLFMALALAGLCAAAWRRGRMPMWLAMPGLAVAALLAGLFMPALPASLHAPLPVPVALAVTSLSAWMAAAGVWCWRRGARTP